MDSPLIRINNVSHTYTGSRPIRALEQISLEVNQGEVVSIVGQSGCGKTTLLKIVAGLVEPTEGQVVTAGLSAEQARRQRKFGMIFQNPVLFPWRTVGENILLPFELSIGGNGGGRPGGDVIGRSAASMVGLEGFWDAYPTQLSGGMQARVAIARALSYEPDVLLMDEAFGSLDEITRTKLNEQLLDLQARTKITMLVVTHSLREAAFLSHRVVVLSARPGRVQTVKTVAGITDRRAWRETAEFSEFCGGLRIALGE